MFAVKKSDERHKPDNKYIKECKDIIERSNLKLSGLAGNYINDSTILGSGFDFMLIIDGTSDTCKLASLHRQLTSINQKLPIIKQPTVTVITVSDFRQQYDEKALATAEHNYKNFLKNCSQGSSDANSANTKSPLRHMR